MATIAVMAFGLSTGGAGFSIAMAMASIVDSQLIMPMLFPPDPIEGAKVDSIDIMSADEGAPAAECYGTFAKTGGQLIWTYKLESQSETSGSRKRGITTTHTYHIRCAVAIAYTPNNPLATIDQVQMDEKVVYRNVNTTAPTTASGTGFGAHVQHDGTSWVFFDAAVNSSIITDVYNQFEVGDKVSWGDSSGSNTGHVFNLSANNDAIDTIIDKGRTKVIYWEENETEHSSRVYKSFFGFRTQKGKAKDYVTTSGIYPDTGWTFSLKPSGLASVVQVVGVGGAGWASGIQTSGTPVIYLGDQTADDPTMDDYHTVSGDNSNLPAFKDMSYIVFNKLNLARWGQRIPNMTFVVSAHADYRTVPTVMSQILSNGNIPTSEFDISNVAGTAVIGYTIKGATELAKKLQPLMIAFNIVAQERGNKIYFHDRASVPSVTVTSGHETAYVGRPSDGVEMEESPYSERVGEINLKFVNSDDDEFRGGQERIVFKNDSIESDNFNKMTKLNMQLPVTMSRSTAKQIAARILYTTHTDVLSFRFNLPMTYLHIQENDKLNVTIGGKSYAMLVRKVDIGANGLIGVEGMQESAVNTNWSDYA
tara:strand:- start:776 stop:2551 length:1776 start_codon:yes stop_codon:yes gene_type:complete